MKNKILIIFLVLAASVSGYAAFVNKKINYAKAKANPQLFVEQVYQQLRKGSQYRYIATSQHPNGSTVQHNGCITTGKDAYVDSNNVHFVFQNKKWLLEAMHQTKYLRCYNFEQLSKDLGVEMKDNFTLNLTPDSNVKYDYAYSKDSLIVTAVRMNKAFGLQKAIFAFPSTGKAKLPYYYKVAFTQPYEEVYGNIINEEEDDLEIDFAAPVFMDFYCYNISTDFDDHILDQERYLSIKNDKVKINVFGNYSIIHSKHN